MTVESDERPTERERGRFFYGRLDRSRVGTNTFPRMNANQAFDALEQEVLALLLRQSGTSPEDLARVLTNFIRNREESSPQSGFVDPYTGLALPAPVALPYNQRHAKYSAAITLEEFLQAEFGAYWTNHLLYAEDIRLTNYSLYEAIRYKARRSGEEFHEYALKLHILTKDHLSNPPPGLERAAAALRASQLAALAATAHGEITVLLRAASGCDKGSSSSVLPALLHADERSF